MDKTSLGDRMKYHEDEKREYLSVNDPIILRIDGKAFHTYTKRCDKPVDGKLSTAFRLATNFTCREIQQCMFAYSQSDEISILLSGWDNTTSDVWFGGNVQKIASVSASIFTVYFNEMIHTLFDGKGKEMAFFDARCWNVPKTEVENYFIWRQFDARCNSISSYARSFYSHKQLLNKKIPDLLKMMEEENGFIWKNLPSDLKWGFTSIKKKDNLKRMDWKIDLNVPDFVSERDYFQKYIWSQMEK